MSLLTPALPARAIVYPDDDGKPMANNSEQGKWLVILYGNLGALLQGVPDVYLAVDHLWYPVEGQPEIATAPDVMVIFGRPRGRRGSYKQWEENSVPVTVAFEVLSPANDNFEMADKFAFYDEYGVEEYYLLDPENSRLAVYVRQGVSLRRVRPVRDFVSPRLGIRFDLSGPELTILYPDGRRFRTFEELEAERVLAEQRATAAEQQARDAQQQARDAQQQARDAQQQARDAQQRAQQVQQHADRQAELIRRVLRQQATPDELQELQRLLERQPGSP